MHVSKRKINEVYHQSHKQQNGSVNSVLRRAPYLCWRTEVTSPAFTRAVPLSCGTGKNVIRLAFIFMFAITREFPAEWFNLAHRYDIFRLFFSPEELRLTGHRHLRQLFLTTSVTVSIMRSS